MANALAHETSPYLRQHAENPVDWLPWGAQALALAAERDVPLLVSIGYSSCHWCHVMERESFEDATVAALMNEEFVCVKVDREERPDVDALYMEAVQGMTGHGGWPLNVFLTPDGLPIYGGTYFPPQPRAGMPSWTQVLNAIAEAWRTQAPELRAGGEQLRARLGGGTLLTPSQAPFDETALDAAVERLRDDFDERNGGFGGAPKFPQAPVLEFLLGLAATRPGDSERSSVEAQMALDTLRAMAAGGIHDQLGGGFHRYAVDATWTVPHFEKMLYDNALLARAYLHAYRLAGDEHFAHVCRDTLEWALREMLAPDGGFYAALDADSDGGEGSFYVWTVAELQAALDDGERGGTDADGDDDRSDGAIDAALAWLGASEVGNFRDPHDPQPGLNVLTARGAAPAPEVRTCIRARLLAARAQRTRPGLDDKRLTSWNALAITALAEAGSVLGERRYLDAATRCAEFVLRELRDADGRLLRSYNAGRAQIPACLDDHAFLIEALLALFEATCAERWLAQARALADETIARFTDAARGGFYTTPADGEALIVRRKDLEDSPIPSGSSSAALGLLRLAQLTGERAYERHALDVLALVHEIAPRHPTAFGHLLQALHAHLAPARAVACAIPPAASDGAASAP